LKVLQTDSSDIIQTDYSNPDATNKINKWVSDKTEGKIPQLFGEQISPDTIFMILSSLYFKGSWKREFSVKHTGQFCWETSTGCNEDVKFMRERAYFPMYTGENFMVIDVPYMSHIDGENHSDSDESKNMKLRMWIPHEVLSTSEDHAKFQKIIAENEKSIDEKIRERDIILVMPKFSIKFDSQLTKQFRNMGVETVFEPGKHFTPLFGPDIDVDASVRSVFKFN